jgi:hypothetical protein
MRTPEAAFTPGPGVAIVAEHWTALLLAEVDDPTVRLLADLAFGDDRDGRSGAAPTTSILEALGRRGFEDLPPLGLVIWEGGICRLVLRGGTAAEVVDHDVAAAVAVDSTGVATWTELVLADAAAVTLTAPTAPTAGPGGDLFRTALGVVPAIRILSRPAPVRADAEPTEPEATPSEVLVPATAPAPAPAIEPPPIPGPAGPANATPAPDPAEGPDGAGAEHDDLHADPDDGRTLVPPLETAAPVAAPDEAPARETDWAEAPPPAGDDGPEPPPAPTADLQAGDAGPNEAESPPAPPDDEDGDYDHLFGSTIVRSVEGAAVRERGQSADDAPAPGATEHGGAVDHDGLTITVSELRRLRDDAGRAGAGPPPPPPSVNPDGEHVARQCQVGHLNPPQATACRACGRPVDGETFRVDQLGLGNLRFSDGRLLPVAGTILIGRSPKAADPGTGDAELVEVPSPNHDISRTHVEVRVEGWQVLVVDRGSTNGTVITIPGRQPQRLRAGEPFPLPVGATVNLADEAEFVYEVEA